MRTVSGRIAERAERAGLEVDERLCEATASYLELLARWNKKINLTALPLCPPTDAALDRLVVEALVAARHVRANDQSLLDIGSGAGSPAIPLILARPALQLTMVEARTRRSAFLREVVRTLGVSNARVETRKFGQTTGDSGLDLITLRAVRLSPPLELAIRGALCPGGRLLLFGAGRHEERVDSWIALARSALPDGSDLLELKPAGQA